MSCRFPTNPNGAHGHHAARPPRALISTRTLHISNDALFTPRVTPALTNMRPVSGKVSLLIANFLLLIDHRALDSLAPVAPMTPMSPITPAADRTPEYGPPRPITRRARENQCSRNASERRKLE